MANQAVTRALAFFEDNQSKLARAIGTSQQRVSYIVNNGNPMPAELVLACEVATGIPRHELRPDIYPPTPEQGMPIPPEPTPDFPNPPLGTVQRNPGTPEAKTEIQQMTHLRERSSSSTRSLKPSDPCAIDGEGDGPEQGIAA